MAQRCGSRILRPASSWRTCWLLANATRLRDITLNQIFPQGLWGDGTTIWAADPEDRRILSYRLPPSSPSDVTLSDLVVSPSPLVPSFTANLRPEFSFIQAFYRVAVPNRASRVTVSATQNNNAATRTFRDANGDVLADADPNAPGFQVEVAVGDTPVAVRIAAGDAASLTR